MAARPARAQTLVLLLVVVCVAGCVPDRPDRGVLPALLAGSPCDAAIRSSLAEWGAEAEYLPAPPARTGTVTLRFPTRERGVWVVAQRTGSGVPTLQRVEASGVTLRSFGVECAADEVTNRRSVPTSSGSPEFDDRALVSILTESELAKDDKGAERGVVVYAWSPHMPLSVDGWTEIEAAAKSVDLVAIPALINEAEEDFARREADRAGIPREGLRRITSVELIMRDVQVHAPAILVFAADRVSPVLPGYRNADGYRRFLEAFLEPNAQTTSSAR